MGPITRTCRLAAALAALLAATAAQASIPSASNKLTPATMFVAARAAANAGDARRAAMLYDLLATADPSNRDLGRRALAQSILAGDMSRALRLAPQQPRGELPIDARLLLTADALKTGRAEKLTREGWPPELASFIPLVEAWTLSDKGRWKDAAARIDTLISDETLGPFVPEHKALMMLAARKAELAKPLVAPAIAKAGGRADRLRLAFAVGFLRAGDQATATELLSAIDPALRPDVGALNALRSRPPISSGAEGFAELLTALAIGLNRDEGGGSLPLALAQVARYADTRNEPAAILLGLLLDRDGRPDDAVAMLRAVPDTSPFVGQARDVEVRILLDGGRKDEALARARAFVASGRQRAGDWVRLGDVFDAMDRHADAVVAYGSAAAKVGAGEPGPALWSVHLLRGAALEQAGQWREAENALELAHKLAPDNAVVLNYLGYARLERGEKLDQAEAMIAEASRRAPDDASITDSLGWAQYKRGKLAEAIATLQRAAAGDPAQAEIHEHLGDALFAAGRMYEARFAWNAALVTAEDDVRRRVEAKIASGLSKANAAP